MREILFRGKRVDNGEWIYGFVSGLQAYSNDKNKKFNDIESYYMNGNIPVKAETVGQYTGLADKNGTKVFEGDIVKTGERLCKSGKIIIRTSIVKYVEGLGYYNPFGDSDISYDSEKVEVTGNIYDNPELFENDYDY